MEKVYATLDKSEWGDGPWQQEPDKIQWTDETTGLPCLLVRQHHGAWCGYVGVPEGHRCYEKDYTDIDLDVHGGLTFAAHCDVEGDEARSICHIPEPGEPDEVWWLGFDCFHAFDLAPAHEAKMMADPSWKDYMDRYHDSRTYCTLDYARDQVTKLAAQLV